MKRRLEGLLVAFLLYFLWLVAGVAIEEHTPPELSPDLPVRAKLLR